MLWVRAKDRMADQREKCLAQKRLNYCKHVMHIIMDQSETFHTMFTLLTPDVHILHIL